MEKIKGLYKTNNYIPLLLIAFALPFKYGVVFALMLALLLYFILGNVKEGANLFFKNKWTYVFLLFFLIHSIAYFFSSNKTEALVSIEIKLGFLVFPLLMFSQITSNVNSSKILNAFVFGTLISTLINFARVAYFYFTEHNLLFYSDFSFFLHPSYYAMYLVFSIVIIAMSGIHVFKKQLYNILFSILLYTLFCAAVFMSSSKLGILSLVIIFPILLGYDLIKRKKIKLLVSLIAGLFLLLLSLSQLTISPVERFKNAFNFVQSESKIDKTTAESNAVRVLVWGESIKIIKNNLLFGLTPGDANDALTESYKREGMTGALNKHLNAHSQYLQTALGTGLIGTLLLIILTFGLLLLGIIKKHALLTIFALLIIFNFLVESMLQTQAGTLFFLFFACLFLSDNFRNNSKVMDVK